MRHRSNEFVLPDDLGARRPYLLSSFSLPALIRSIGLLFSCLGTGTREGGDVIYRHPRNLIIDILLFGRKYLQVRYIKCQQMLAQGTMIIQRECVQCLVTLALRLGGGSYKLRLHFWMVYSGTTAPNAYAYVCMGIITIKRVKLANNQLIT